jgi:FKBP-type peptidyl-prolyl cis-trans isomerase 2
MSDEERHISFMVGMAQRSDAIELRLVALKVGEQEILITAEEAYALALSIRDVAEVVESHNKERKIQ